MTLSQERRVRSVDWHLVLREHGPQPTWGASSDSSGVVSVLAAAEELARCETLSRLTRRAVEIAREKIGLERVGLFLKDPNADVMCGTWGTGSDGTLLDESDLQFGYGELEREAHRRAEAGAGRWLLLRNAPLVAHGPDSTESLGHGWVALTPVRSPRGPVGILYNDAGISRGPFERKKQVRLAVLASLLGNLIEARQDPVSQRSPALRRGEVGVLVRRAIATLNEDPTESAVGLAGKLSVSAGHLTRAFRAEVGSSLVEYRNRVRLERFFALVEQGGGNLAEAALNAGFGSYAQFHRVFRRFVGVTPREYLLGARPRP